MNDAMINTVVQGEDIYGVAAITTTMVAEAQRLHGTSPTVTAALGRLLTGGALMAALLKDEAYRVSLQVNCRGPVRRLLAEADGRGYVRGYVGRPTVDLPSRNGKLDVGGVVGKGVLHVLKEVGLPEPQTGAVPLVSGEIAEDLAAYFDQSEQIPSAVSLGVFINPHYEVVAAGGFLLQFHATIADELVSHIEKALAQVPSATTMIQEGYQPLEILQQALGGLPVDVVRENIPLWYCACSQERVVRALIAIGAGELRQLIADNQDTEVKCEFCTAAYVFRPQDLVRILDSALT
jgi:molecular chaperone Hsp33